MLWRPEWRSPIKAGIAVESANGRRNYFPVTVAAIRRRRASILYVLRKMKDATPIRLLLSLGALIFLTGCSARVWKGDETRFRIGCHHFRIDLHYYGRLGVVRVYRDPGMNLHDWMDHVNGTVHTYRPHEPAHCSAATVPQLRGLNGTSTNSGFQLLERVFPSLLPPINSRP